MDIAVLLETMRRLRHPETGCQWDCTQTHDSLIPHLQEEMYETIAAIASQSPEALKEELGDLLFQIVFHCQLAEEAGHFSWSEVVNTVNEKMVRRHPHVFSNVRYESIEAQKAEWQKIKQQERQARQTQDSQGLWLEQVHQGRPSQEVAIALQQKAAEVGFDWSNINDVLEKGREEIEELSQAIVTQDAAAVREEFGDLIFVIMNIARHLQLHPETVLSEANHKFIKRFNFIEQQLRQQDRQLQDSSLEEMEALWQQAKQT